MTDSQLQNIIEAGWDSFNSTANNDTLKQNIDQVFTLLDQGKIRVAEKVNGNWQTNSWIKKAILLSFRLYNNQLLLGTIGAFGDSAQSYNWYDKIPLKFSGWDEAAFKQAGIRAVPGSIVRRSTFIDKGAILLPSFVNVGAHIGENTMIDAWVTIGSCAQIGKNCHISGGVGIGGVLEPLQSNPVIIEDNCFIGARSEVAEGVVIREGAVLSMGLFISASTKIVDRATGHVSYGEIPPYSVVLPGTIAGKDSKTFLNAAIIVKTVDEKTRSKTSINDILRS